jgi:protein MpaA
VRSACRDGDHRVARDRQDLRIERLQLLFARSGFALAAAAGLVLLGAAAAPGSPPPVPKPKPPPPKRIMLGRSVEGRPITVERIGDPRAAVRVLVVGCIHGAEPAGIAVAHLLEADAAEVPPGVGLWVIDDLNPDGRAAHLRTNANLVDLNRNFPYDWAYLDRNSGEYGGPWPLSEPEARIAARLILKIRPTLTIWYHQPFHVVDLSGGDPVVERRYAKLVGFRVKQLTRFTGSVASWEDNILDGSTAFVVELPAKPLTKDGVQRHGSAVLELAKWLTTR